MTHEKTCCNLGLSCYSLFMQNDFTTQMQSDEFASEWEKMRWLAIFEPESLDDYMHELEKKYWLEISANSN